jgi:ClpP class serine protease
MLTVSRAANILHRPQLIREADAPYWAGRLLNLDPRAAQRRANPLGIVSRLASLMGRPMAMDDDDGEGEARKEPTRPLAYQPRWLGDIDGEGEMGWTLKDGVALLNIDTPLVENGFGFCGTWFHGYDSIQAAFEEMDADSRVKAIFVRWDTPGGVVAPGIYDLTAALQARRAEAKEGAKPTWSYCDMACSAGYWLPAQTDHLAAPKVGMIGSIGAVLTHVSYAGMLEKDGIKVTPIHFGKFKTEGSPYADLSEESLAHLQAEIDELGEDFVAAVAAGRGAKLTAEQARASEARVFLGDHRIPEESALARGFVDAILPQPEAFAALREIAAKSGATFPAVKPAGSTAAPAASTETAMQTREQRIEAVMAGKTSAKTAEEKLEEIRKIMDEEDDADAEGEGDDVDDEEADPDAEGETDDEKEAKARAGKAKPAATIDPAVAQAILDLPEAKGREALARRLAFKPGMTVAEAKADLAAAPRASRLADKVTDPKLSADAPADTRSDVKKESDAAIRIAGIRLPG